ncbi:flagellin [Thalassobacillus pellis]|uniref:flagellin N-terminal helical domain-containing protein n=1 Tax=Thalassobacillus pellis TaxID=748008 RepID=UPI0019600B1D|nr:flagellin [Thalassobacillus pellis]MBM7551569.1 flagellin [Thalassobacillus pellis]
MRINHNIAALNTYRQLGQANNAMGNSMEKLSSGLRINKAGDDAAGLAISEKMRGQIRGLDMAAKNAQDGISLIQTAEGALNETHSILQRMRELSVQSANDTNTASDRSEIQKEIDQLTDEVDRIANNTEFNTKKLLTGAIGAKVDNGDQISSLQTSSNTAAGTYNINLATGSVALAEKAKVEIATTTGTDTVSGNGTLEIDVNGSKTVVTIEAGEKLSDVADRISNSVAGVTAKYDSDNDKFIVESTEVGSDQTVTVTESTTNALTSTTDVASGLSGTGTDVDLVAGDIQDASSANIGFSLDGNNVKLDNGISFEVTAVDKDVDITVSDSLTFQIGANEGQNLSLAINAMDAENLGISQIDVTTQEGADSAITKINNAIETVSSERSKLGAYQNRLDHTINNLGTSSENLTAAESRIRDVDYASAA